MIRSTAIAALAVVLALGAPARAQETPAAPAPEAEPQLEPAFGLAPESVVNWLNTLSGLEAQLAAGEAQPMIQVTDDRLSWLVIFYGCREGLCPDAQFSAGFRNPSITLETVNDWNRERRYLKAHFQAGEPPAAIVQQDVMLTRQTNMEEFAEHLVVWRNTLPLFAVHTGYFVVEAEASAE